MNPMIGPISRETIEFAKQALSQGFDRDSFIKGAAGSQLSKAVTVATGLTWYDLQAPSKLFLPVVTPLRNAIPRVRRGTPGDAAHWKVLQLTPDVAFGSGYDAMGWVPEGQRSGAMSYTSTNASATYVTIGEEDNLTLQAEAAAIGLEDENAEVTLRLLQKVMLKEEMAILGGNRSMSLGTPGTIATSASGSGSSLTSTTYYASVVALTVEGYYNNQGWKTNGILQSKTITGMDGNTYVLNGGSSNKSAEQSQSVTAGQNLLLSVPAVTGAVAYAWYAGTSSGATTLQAVTTINSVSISAIAGGRQSITAITGDFSKNANLAFDGLLPTAQNSSSAYINVMATGTAGTGTTLTASGRGTVVEIDNMLQTMWNTYQITPTVIYVNAQEMKNIINKCLSSASGPLLRRNQEVDAGAYNITAGGGIDYYFNPFHAAGGAKIPIKLHPRVPPGTLICWAEQLPPWYVRNDVPNVAEMLINFDYRRIDWPVTTLRRDYGIYAYEVLAVYAPFAMGIITNIADG